MGSKATRNCFSIARYPIAKRNHAWTPAYRAPECDIENAPVMRSSDIWSLGCVFSEMICWILGGHELKEQFEERRIANDLNGLLSLTSFEIVPQGDYHVARIKPAVTQFFDDLRTLPHGTEYIWDLLDIVQHHMLVINSEDEKRISSKELVHRLEKMDKWVYDDMSYAIEPVPPSPITSPISLIFR
ncbi:hypothetical protein F5Y19DRAFT_325711 [Xylariaceae sp. FL1651]|nr:hypothetical protein F5Y19DRAFT_325711 [Xylariaceae sp. FL1651]